MNTLAVCQPGTGKSLCYQFVVEVRGTNGNCFSFTFVNGRSGASITKTKIKVQFALNGTLQYSKSVIFSGNVPIRLSVFKPRNAFAARSTYVTTPKNCIICGGCAIVFIGGALDFRLNIVN